MTRDSAGLQAAPRRFTPAQAAYLLLRGRTRTQTATAASSAILSAAAQEGKCRGPTAPTELPGRPAFKFKMSSASQRIGLRSVMTSRDSPSAARSGACGGERRASPRMGKARETQRYRNRDARSWRDVFVLNYQLGATEHQPPPYIRVRELAVCRTK